MSRLSVWLLKAIRCPDIALKYVPWQKYQGILFEIHWVWTELSEFYGSVQTHCIFKSSLEYRHSAKPFSSFFATLSLFLFALRWSLGTVLVLSWTYVRLLLSLAPASTAA